MKLCYLGPEGTFGELAALRAGPEAHRVPLPSHAEIVHAVVTGAVDSGVLPVENSVEGSVNESLDLVLREPALRVLGEVVVAVEQCLVARPGTRARDVELVHSHPHALGQCRGFLEREVPRAHLQAALSTSQAVLAALSQERSAAIASARAAEIHGAKILARGIQDAAGNVTRFWIVGLSDAQPTGRDKTSIAFKTAHDRPGSLVNVLAVLSERGLNMTKIESRPSKDALGVYVFLVDFEGHRAEAEVAGALDELAARTSWLRVFGSYPRFQA